MINAQAISRMVTVSEPAEVECARAVFKDATGTLVSKMSAGEYHRDAGQVVKPGRAEFSISFGNSGQGELSVQLSEPSTNVENKWLSVSGEKSGRISNDPGSGLRSFLGLRLTINTGLIPTYGASGTEVTDSVRFYWSCAGRSGYVTIE